MKINIDNYESYILDLIENRITEEDKSNLKLFLKHNTHLMNTLEYESNCKIIAENIKYPHKSSLKKFQFNNSIIDENNVSEYIIAFYENDLDEKSKNNLLVYLKTQDNLNNEFLEYSKVYLQPEEIQYKNKINIYRKRIFTRKYNFKYFLRIAAGILLIISLYLTHFINVSKTENLMSKMDIKPKIDTILITSALEPKVKAKISKFVDKSDQKKYKKIQENSLLLSSNLNSKKNNEFERINIKTKENISKDEEQKTVIDSIETKPVEFQESEKPILDENDNLSTIQKEYSTYREPDNKKKTVFKIIQAGISFINKNTGSNIQLKCDKNSKGYYGNLSFETRYLKIYTKVKQ